MSEQVTVRALPTCDICVYVEEAPDPAPAGYDGKTKQGPWANMCEKHWKTHSLGRLGTGYGQRLVVREN